MVRTRSGQAPKSIEPTPKRVYLKRSDIRPHADDSHHACPICLEDMSFLCDKCPQRAQCPTCKEAMHETRLQKNIRRQDTEIACPTCRTTYAVATFEQDIGLWSADTLLARLVVQDDSGYANDSSSDLQEDVERCLRPRFSN